MENLNVFYNIDNNYVDIAMASMISLIENSKINIIDFHIATVNFDFSCYQKIERLYQYYPNINIFYYDLEKFPIDQYNINSWRGTQVASSRLFFQSMIGDKVKNMNNLLYLDADTITMKSLLELKQYTNGIYLSEDAGMMKYYKNRLGILGNYYNSGVIYINVPYWIENNCEEKIKSFLFNNDTSKLTYPDQDILNISLNEELKSFSLSYNYPIYFKLLNNTEKRLFFNKNRNISYEDAIQYDLDPNIIHAYGSFGIYPWSNNHVNPYNDIFMKYIYQANDNYTLMELDQLRKIISYNKYTFKAAIITRGYIPEEVCNKIKKLLKK